MLTINDIKSYRKLLNLPPLGTQDNIEILNVFNDMRQDLDKIKPLKNNPYFNLASLKKGSGYE